MQFHQYKMLSQYATQTEKKKKKIYISIRKILFNPLVALYVKLALL